MFKQFKSVVAASATIFPILASTPAYASTEPVTGDPVLYWHEVLQTALTGSPTVQSRGYAMVSVALHDAVNASLGKPNKAYIPHIAATGGDTRAAAAVAARNVLVHLNPAKTAEFDAALANSLALVPNGTAKTAGMNTGAAISAAVIANRTGDGSASISGYVPSGLPGRWAPTPPGFAPAAVPQYAQVDPWFMTAPTQFRAAAPPAIESVAYANAFLEVRDIGAAGSLIRTSDQTNAALFWAGANGTGPWIRAGIDQAQAAGLSTLQNAALFARLSTAVADATIATWDTKYFYDYWRPVTAIRRADEDGNALTIADPGWTPLIGTPPHPSYLSAHGAVGGAAATILASTFGAGGNFCLVAGGNTRCWNGFEAAALDGANSRLWGGIHWRFDNENGLALGQAVGRFTLSRAVFGAVPEPSAWTLMIVGFGIIGAKARSRRRALRFAPLGREPVG